MQLFLFISVPSPRHFCRVRERNHLPDGSLLKCPQQPSVGQAQVRCYEFKLCIPYGWQGANYLSNNPLPSRVYITRKLDSEAELGLWCAVQMSPKMT